MRERIIVIEICAGAYHGGQKKKIAALHQYAEPKEASLGPVSPMMER